MKQGRNFLLRGSSAGNEKKQDGINKAEEQLKACDQEKKTVRLNK